jgi:hypothetical protein
VPLTFSVPVHRDGAEGARRIFRYGFSILSKGAAQDKASLGDYHRLAEGTRDGSAGKYDREYVNLRRWFVRWLPLGLEKGKNEFLHVN